MTMYNFGGVANGQPWPSPWTTKALGSNTADVQSEEGRISGSTVSFNPGGASIHQAQAQADIDIAMAFRFTNITDHVNDEVGLVTRGTYSGGQLLSGYRLDVHNGGTGIALVRETGASDTELASFSVGVDISTTYIARMRTRTVGSTVEIDAKVWAEATDEPAWQIEYVDSSGSRITAAGQFAVHLVTAISGSTVAVLVREVEVINPNDFDYTVPILTATLDDSDYSVDLSWTGDQADAEIQRETWTGRGEPWL